MPFKFLKFKTIQLNTLSQLGDGWKNLIIAISWFLIISFLHYWLNFLHEDRRIITMGYMPVVTNLSAPILDQVSKKANSGRYRFVAMKFASFAEMAESLRHGHIDAAFMIAPLAIVLRQQKEDIKVVYIGNRHESTLVTRKDLNIKSLVDLAGKTIAVPMRYSGHNLGLRRLLAEQAPTINVKIVEMNPPDMAAALTSGALDAYFVGEPFAATTLLNGKAQKLFYVEKIWKNFICNLLVVRQKFIATEPEAVKALITGAVRAGLWAKEHPDAAAKIASKYWGQPKKLVKYAINNPPNRIVYDKFIPKVNELEEIAELMVRFGLAEQANIEGLIDASFATMVNLGNIKFENILPQ